MNILFKKCVKCKQELPATNFCKYHRSKDGYAYQCKACIKEYQIANQEKLKAYQKAYQPGYKAEHKEELKAYLANYQKTVYKEKHLAYLKKWKAANPDKVKQYLATMKKRKQEVDEQ